MLKKIILCLAVLQFQISALAMSLDDVENCVFSMSAEEEAKIQSDLNSFGKRFQEIQMADGKYLYATFIDSTTAILDSAKTCEEYENKLVKFARKVIEANSEAQKALDTLYQAAQNK